MNKVLRWVSTLSIVLLAAVSPGVSHADNSLQSKVYEQVNQIIDDGEYSNNKLFKQFNEFAPHPFIIGGAPTSRNEFPEFTLVILTNSTGDIIGLCGGTVIASNKVLTAAHCAQNRASTYFLIPNFYSFNDRVTASDFVRVSRVVDHPRYIDQGFDFDVAVMTLSQPVSVEPVSVIKGASLLVGKVGEVIGVGLTATEPEEIAPEVLMGVDAPIITNQECSQRYVDLIGSDPITNNMVCAGFRNSSRGACSGDSGSPLFITAGGRKAVAGVVSFGLERCEAQRATSVYMRTSSFTNFISQQSPSTKFVEAGGITLAPIYSLLLDDAAEAGSPNPEAPQDGLDRASIAHALPTQLDRFR